MRIPDAITIVTWMDGQETTGMFVMVKFLMAQKNPYNLAFGPSEAGGAIHLTGEHILAEARKTADLFPMDYAAIETHWTGKLAVAPMNRAAIARALSARKLFQRYHYPLNYERDLHAADVVLARTPAAKLTVTVECDPAAEIDVETVAVRATGD